MNWRSHIQHWTKALKRKCKPKVHIEIGKPISSNELDLLEEDITYQIPACLRDFMRNESSLINFWWHLKPRINTPIAFNFPRSGYIEFTPTSLIILNDNRMGFLDGDEPAPVLEQWQHAFRFMGPGNGDQIALDMSTDSISPPVIYLNHEEPEKQLRLANSFSEFIDAWFFIGCAGPENEELKPFLTENSNPLPNDREESTVSKLDPSCLNAIAFRSFFGLQ
jgi:SMI1 / KNR4 family (SUKH-1)